MAKSVSKKQTDPELALTRERIEDTLDRLKKTHTDELVFALCGPIGSPLHHVAEKLQDILKAKFGYQCDTIKLSSFIEQKGAQVPVGASSFERVNHLVTEGNKLREKYGKGVLAELGISEIFRSRAAAKLRENSDRFTPQRFCHIFDSVKNQQELDVLRAVYGDLLICIGVFSPHVFRIEELEKRKMAPWEVLKLVDRDSGEEIAHGQTVRDTFPQADFFLKVDSKVANQIEEKVERLLNLITRLGISTPTSHEAAMYMAASSALNSACLSRQVGAAVTDKDGLVLGVGWNDVPKFGGGLYGAEDETKKKDFRCIKMDGGVCFNDREKARIASETISELVKAGIIDSKKAEEATEKILKSKVKDLIEFSRAVHAEVLAIIHASQASGSLMRGGRLYCTTYPCHSCARHIIAAGVSEVYFIEPYRKSLATTLHGDAITEDESEDQKVRLLPYEGVAPRRFNDLFTMKPGSRKQNGQAIRRSAMSTKTASEISLESFPVLEAFIVDQLQKEGLLAATAVENEQPA